jgi:hypothetical protein
MATLQIQLSDDLEVERLAREAGYSDPGAYLEALVRADRKRKAEEWIATEIQRGLDSGPSREIGEDDVRAMVEEYDRRMLAQRRGSRVE